MLWQRVITALLLLPVVLGAILFLPNDFFAAFMAVPVLLGGLEWVRMAPVNRNVFMALLAGLIAAVFVLDRLVPGVARPLWLVAVLFWLWALLAVIRYPGARDWYKNRVLMHVIGLMLLVPTWYAVVELQAIEFSIGNSSLYGLVLLAGFVVVWSADIGAYFAGRAFGRRKLAVHVSPGKSVEGAVGGLLLALLLGGWVASALSFDAHNTRNWLALVFVTTLASILGDLFESMVKREAGVKDSGTLLPGHGGVLDRIDSVTCALPIFALGYFALQILPG